MAFNKEIDGNKTSQYIYRNDMRCNSCGAIRGIFGLPCCCWGIWTKNFVKPKWWKKYILEFSEK